MEAMNVLGLITQIGFVLIALLTLIDYLRSPTQVRLNVVLLFGAFAAIVLIQWLLSILDTEQPWLARLMLVLLLAHPYLLLGVVRHLRPAPAGIQWWGLVGFGLSALLLLFSPTPLPLQVVIPILLYVIAGDGYAAYSLIDGSRKTTGVVQRRLQLAATGTGLIALLILNLGVQIIFPVIAPFIAMINQLVGLASVVCFYLSFSIPAFLRRVWQYSELHRFLLQISTERTSLHSEETLGVLCVAARRGASGDLAVATRWDERERRMLVAATSNGEAGLAQFDTGHPACREAWEQRKPVFTEQSLDLALSPAGTNALPEVKGVYIVPIATQERAWGLLLVFLSRLPIFAQDDLSLLSLLCEQTATALGYVHMLASQERMIDRLRRYNERLEAVTQIDHKILQARLPGEIAHVALAHLQRIVPYDRASVVLFNEQNREAHYLAVEEPVQLGLPEGTVLSIEEFSFLEQLTEPVFVIGNIATEQHSPHLIETKRRYGISSLILVPLKIEEQLIGVFSLSSRQSDTYQPEHQVIALELSRQLAIAIQQARLRQELQRTNAELERRVAERTTQLEQAVRDLQTEVAARQKTSEALDAAQQRLQFLLSSTPAIIYSIDTRDARRVTYISENVYHQLGYETDVFLNDPGFWSSQIHPTDAERVRDYLANLPPGDHHALEYRFLNSAGQYIWMRDEFRVICDEQGAPVEIVGYWIDINKRREAEESILILNEDLNRRALELQAANRELEAFAYSVSHDLRAPLRAIDGFSRVLVSNFEAELSEEARRYLRLISKNTHEMGQLIDDLLSFSRINKQSLNVDTVEPDWFIPVILRDLFQENDGREIEIVRQPLPSCKGDYNLLKQVFTNLLSNAFKFTRTRQKARIEIGGEVKGNEAVFFVKDNGVGFDMKYANKLFGVFQRLHLAEEFEGTGVGLAIVQRIVHRHGGRVWAEGELDRGAAFYITVPRDSASG